MDRDQAREIVRGKLEEYLQQKGIDTRKNFKCFNASKHKNGDKHPSMSFDQNRNKAHCFSCGADYDTLDLIGMDYGLTGEDLFLKAYSLFNIQIDNPRKASAEEDFKPMYQNQPKTEQYTHNNIHTNTYTHKEEEPEADQTAFFKEAHAHMQETDYWKKRGIIEKIAERFKLGYAAAWRHPKVPATIPLTPRLIIPTSQRSYIARDTREDIPEGEKKYSKSKVGKVRIFNSEALQISKKPIFLTEGEIDALCIMSAGYEAGAEAVGLGSTANWKNFLQLTEKQKPAQPLIIALDNDTAGETAAQEIEEGLRKQGIPHYRMNLYGDSKDAGEAILKDREALISAMEKAYEKAYAVADEAEQAEREAYLKTSTAHYLQSFIDGIPESVNTPCISTGFSSLDNVLDGGLYEGLYVIGAISSLGKTTLIAQIADQIAQAGTDVLFFSLEMARNELISKSVSRHTLIKTFESKIPTSNAKTARGITTGKRYVNYSKAERDLITSSIQAYSVYAEHIYISEGVGDIGAIQIREAVERHISLTGNKPVVIVDYLQILAPYNERFSDKQNNDKAMLELKRTSRDNKIPLIAISSFNRENYKEEVNMSAFKETGSIEYSSDVLIGLQLKGAGKKDFDATEEKKRDPRSIELVILKNRNGRVGDRLPFQYYPLFNFFKEG